MKKELKGSKVRVVWHGYIDDYEQYIAYCEQGNRQAMICIGPDELGNIDLYDDNAILSKMQQIMETRPSLYSLPRLEDAADITQYLVCSVMDSDNNMFYLNKEDIGYIEERFGKTWDELASIIEKDIERFHLEFVLEVFTTEVKTNFDYVATCFGNLQFAFSQSNP